MKNEPRRGDSRQKPFPRGGEPKGRAARTVQRARPGRVWTLGRHRLVCGDATNAADVAAALGGQRPLMMVTDPPYGVNYDPTWRAELGPNADNSTLRVLNDDRCDWTPAWKLFPGDVVYVWHSGLHATEAAQSLVAAGFRVRSQIVWAKTRHVLSRGHYHWQHEPCWYGVRRQRTATWTGDRKQKTVWTIANGAGMHGQRDDQKTGHSAQKPLECMLRPMRNHGQAGAVVYDAFTGSGTTLIAAEMLDRVFVGLEISPEYCGLIIDRWQQFTGRKAKREA